MRDFEYYLKMKVVFKRSPDKKLAEGLIEDAKARLSFAEENTEKEPKYAFENAYEAVRELIDALMALDGYKSYSHEASIAFLKKLKDFSDTELEILDSIRKRRNDSKYYGRSIDVLQAEEDIKLLKNVFQRLVKIIGRNVAHPT